MHHMSHVTPHNIAYAVVLISSIVSWQCLLLCLLIHVRLAMSSMAKKNGVLKMAMSMQKTFSRILLIYSRSPNGVNLLFSGGIGRPPSILPVLVSHLCIAKSLEAKHVRRPSMSEGQSSQQNRLSVWRLDLGCPTCWAQCPAEVLGEIIHQM
jgi:hypothetical protein